MKELFLEVINDIKPNREYEISILSKSNEIIGNLSKKIKDAKIILGGSGAKGTWLKTFDVDIFVKFNYKKYKDKSDQLSDILYKKLKKIYPKIIRLHGSRDYFQLKQAKFTFEIIPILDITKADHAKNITDVSPLHSKFVLKYKHLKDEIRLTKQFCESCGVYGAESYIKGFSGYICEILTINYGSFLNLIKKAAKWEDKVMVDVKKYYKGKDVFIEINKSKLVSPLIVIDPVQKDRNAAAALSQEKFEIFKKKAREFLKKPSKNFFKVEEFDPEKFKDKYKSKNLILLQAEPLRKKDDVAGAKLLKTFEFLQIGLIKNEFKILKSDWYWNKNNKAYFYFIFDEKLLSTTKEIIGPPIKIKNHVINFKKKYKKTKIKNKKITAVVSRRFRKPKDFLKELIKDEYVKDKIKSVRIIN